MPKKGNVQDKIQIDGLVAGGGVVGHALDEDPDLVPIHFDARTVAPGDQVSARILGKRGREWQGRVESIQIPSNHRQKPRCQHFGVCGGCGFQHWPYAIQLQHKESLVRRLLAPWIDRTDLLPILGCKEQWFFRNKMEFTASARAYMELPPAERPIKAMNVETGGAIGLFVPYCGNKVLDVHQCLLQEPRGDAIRNWLRDYAETNDLPYYHSTTHTGWLRTLLIRTTRQGQVLVMFIVASDSPAPDRSDALSNLVSDFNDTFPDTDSVWTLINPKLNDSYADLRPVHVAGRNEIVENLDGLLFSIGPQTFFQVNSRQTLVLYQRIIELAGMTGSETVYDLYCGVGSISAFLARSAAKVVGIEYVESSVIAARENFRQNDLNNGLFIAGDMKDLLVPALFSEHGAPDIVISDPPRAGMHPKACQTLANCGAKRIIYVSCNPESLARDLALLTENYRLTAVQAIDLMPHSYHVETMAVLELR